MRTDFEISPVAATGPIHAPLIVGFGGTTRAQSSSEQLAVAVLAECARLGARTQMFGGTHLLRLPHFDPTVAHRTPEQIAFLDAVRAADGLIITTPGYHSGVSALVKNAIDLLEDTRTDARVYFDGLPVGLVVSAAGWQAGGMTLTALRGIVHAMGGWPTPLGIAVNTVSQQLFDDTGDITDMKVVENVQALALQVTRAATLLCANHKNTLNVRL